MTDAAQPEVAEISNKLGSTAGNALGSALQTAWWFSLGLLATLGEQTTRVAGGLVEKGRAVEPGVVRPMKRAASELSAAAQRSRMSRPRLPSVRMPALLPADGPSKEEFDRLVKEVKSLRERLAESVDRDKQKEQP
jgi:hypothetical protein